MWQTGVVRTLENIRMHMALADVHAVVSHGPFIDIEIADNPQIAFDFHLAILH